MEFNKTNDIFTDTTRKYFAFTMKIPVILAVLVLLFFIIKAVSAQSEPDKGIIDQQKQTNNSDKSNAAAGQLNKLHPRNCRKILVGVYENKPKIFTDETGAASGIFVDILNEIAQKEKWQLTYVPCEWFECLKALKNGRIDLMPDVAFSQERHEQFNFHKEEVISSWSMVYVKSRKQISAIFDLNDRRIAILKGSIQEKIFEQMVNGLEFQVALIKAGSYEEAFLLVARGAADAVVVNHFYGDYFHHQYGLEKTSIVFNPVSLYFAAASGANYDLLKAIDKNLRVMKSQPGSVYYKTLWRWMGKTPKIIVSRYLIWIIAGFGGLLVLAIGFILLLRWQVRAGTRNLAYVNIMLHKSETKFRELFHKHAAVKLLIDPDNGNIVEANKAAEKFYGWSGEQLRQMRIQDINTLPPEQVKAEMEKAKNLERTQFEFQHRLADGSIRDVAVFSSRIDIQERPLLHAIIHDITRRKEAEKERKKLQAQFIQAQKMESVGRLAGGVAHDYNNMLSVILGYTELALMKIDPSDPLHDYLKTILDAAMRSASITRQLLAFARKQVVEPVVFDLNKSVESLLKMLQRLIGENIEMAWLPMVSIWPIRIDPSQVDQILANLCVNARDAIADVGKLTIETDNVTFDEAYCAEHAGYVPGEYVLLSVSDDGCGMDKETLDHVFEPFFTTKGMGEGTGLGLATIYGIIKQNNGFINVYSEKGKGTTFRLYFPRHKGTIDNVTAESAEEIPQGCGERVLLVEDDQTLLDLGKKMLEIQGYQALRANTPDEAMRLAQEYAGSIDLLITDVVMPEMNGRDLADRLHAFCPSLKTLFMSGYTANVIAHRGVLDEGVNFIQKPFSIKELAVKISKTLGRE